MGRLYARFALFLQGLVIVCGTLAFVLLHPKTLDWAMRKALKNNGVEYRSVHGSLMTGVTLEGLGYRRLFFAEEAEVRYSIFRLLRPTPTVDRVALKRAVLDLKRLDELPKEKKGENNATSNLYIPPIVVKEVAVDGFTLRTPDPVRLDLKARDLRYFDFDVTIPAFELAADTPWAGGRLKGALHRLAVTARGRVWPSKAYAEAAQNLFDPLPRSLPVEVEANLSRVSVATELPALRTKEGNVTLRQVRLAADYFYGPGYMEAKAKYGVQTPFARAEVNQSFLLAHTLAYATELQGRILQSAHPLPSTRFEADASGDADIVTADLKLDPFAFALYSTDYRRFAMRFEARPRTLDYVPELPKIFRDQTLSMEGNATLETKPSPLFKGVVQVDGNYSRSHAFVEATPETLLVRAKVSPYRRHGGVWAMIPEKFRSEIHAFLYNSPDNKIFDVSLNDAYLTLFERQKKIRGWANVGSLTLDAKGEVLPGSVVDIDFYTHIESLYALMADFNLTTQTVVDAEVESRFNVRVADWITIRYDTKIPWYLIQPDSQHVYYGLDSRIQGSLEERTVHIDRYEVGFMKHRLKEERTSTLRIDENMTVEIENLALLDTGNLKGIVDPKAQSARLRLEGERMHYRGPEGNVTFDAHLFVDANASALNAEGEVKFHGDTVITYMPEKSYTVTDEDIVIVQDVREPSHTAKSLDIRLYSDEPIHYRIPHVKVDLKPDVTVWKEPFKPFGLLGIVRLTGGAIDVADKHFTVLPSEIYFAGAYPPNPYLDVRIGYEVDYNKFTIYVSHTLSDPVFLFSSEPPMSQNDIMSYILFGTPADESMQGGRDLSNSVATMILGVGIKNAIGAATGLHFDTFNILNTDKGGFGVEIGKRIGKRLRIIYRNDSLSSFILQYTLSRSVRVSVDVSETGQGVNILYVRDMKSPSFLLPEYDRQGNRRKSSAGRETVGP